MSRRKKYNNICKFTHKGEPYTKSNQLKVWRGKATYPSHIIEYEKALAAKATEVCDKNNIKPYQGPIRLKINYYLKSRIIKDLPNLPKTTADSLIGSVYVDDYYIVEMHIKKLYDPNNPRVEIQVDEILCGDTPYTSIYPIGDGNRQTPNHSKKPKRKYKKRKKKVKASE